MVFSYGRENIGHLTGKITGAWLSDDSIDYHALTFLAVKLQIRHGLLLSSDDVQASLDSPVAFIEIVCSSGHNADADVNTGVTVAAPAGIVNLGISLNQPNFRHQMR